MNIPQERITRKVVFVHDTDNPNCKGVLAAYNELSGKYKNNLYLNTEFINGLGIIYI